ncbi:MAG: hypothetical protein D6731_18665 [Planctomycetota bacterium]|nr:MAG: hypothetical protein D6731_18665 [Planctomycetota bacterium]
MKDQPLARWFLGSALRNRRTLFGLLLFALLFYGLLGLSFLFWLFVQPSWRRDLEDLFAAFHHEAWVVNAGIFLVVLPLRFAQRLARDRHSKALEMLRLAGLSGWDIAWGKLAAAALLPGACGALTAPAVVLGALAVGEAGSARAYLALAGLCPVYTALAGLVALGARKRERVLSAAVLSLLLPAGLGLAAFAFRLPEFLPVGALAPWAGAFARGGDAAAGRVVCWGTVLPLEAIALPVQLLLTLSLWRALAGRLAGRPMALFGLEGATSIGLAYVFLAGVGFTPCPLPKPGVLVSLQLPSETTLTIYLVVCFLASLFSAAEAGVSWRDLVRGLARSDPDDPPFPEERLRTLRFLPGALLPAVLGGLLVPPLRYGYDTVWDGAPAPVSPAGVCIALLVFAGGWMVAGLCVQALLLLTKGRGAPRLLAFLLVGGLWLLPYAAAGALSWVGAPLGMREFARTPSVFFGIAAAMTASGGGATSPLALAAVSAAMQGGIATALFLLVLRLRERAREHAAGLVALPADAHGAPGSLTRRCSRGHAYAEAWARCPHCAPGAEEPTA